MRDGYTWGAIGGTTAVSAFDNIGGDFLARILLATLHSPMCAISEDLTVPADQAPLSASIALPGLGRLAVAMSRPPSSSGSGGSDCRVPVMPSCF